MAELTLMKNTAEQQLADEWQQAKGRLPGLAALRAAAFEKFARTGLPHRRVEEWKYTDLRALMREAKPLAQRPVDDATKNAGRGFAGLDARRLVMANGYSVPEWSDHNDADPGVTIAQLFTFLGENILFRSGALPDDPAIALN